MLRDEPTGGLLLHDAPTFPLTFNASAMEIVPIDPQLQERTIVVPHGGIGAVLAEVPAAAVRGDLHDPPGAVRGGPGDGDANMGPRDAPPTPDRDGVLPVCVPGAAAAYVRARLVHLFCISLLVQPQLGLL